MATRRKPRILQVITTSEFGGAQDVVLNICQALKNHYEPAVITTPGGILVEKLRALGIPVYTVCIEHNSDPRVIWQIRSIIRKINPDLVHAHDARAAFTASLATLLAGARPFLYHVHLFNPWRARPGFHRLIDGVSCRLSTRIIACSEYLRNYLAETQGISRESLVAIPNCVDIEKFAAQTSSENCFRLELPDNAFVLLCCARLTANKGISHLLTALARLKNSHPHVHLVLAGDGELGEELVATASALGIADRVLFAGFLSDVRSALLRCDAYVQPSLVEGLPISVLEAMSMGKPVIATAVSGTPEIVQDEQTGLCVPAADPAALSHAIMRFVEHPASREAMAEKGKRLVRRDYSLDSLRFRLHDLYTESLQATTT